VGTWNLFVLENELRSSPKCKEVFGHAADSQFQYEDFLSSVHPDDGALVEATIAQALDPKGTGLYELDWGPVRMYGPPSNCKGKARDERHVCASVFGLLVEVRSPGHDELRACRS